MNKGEIILYQPDDTISLEVRIEDETVWLTQAQMSKLFQKDRTVITRHINNIFKEGELDMEGNVHFLHFANSDRPIGLYNLDVIISVGYRVKSQIGTRFRRWANSVLKEYILRGYAVNRRIEQLENKVAEHDKQIAFFVRTSLPPVQGIFYDGQIFDAYVFASELIRSTAMTYILFLNRRDVILWRLYYGVPTIFSIKVALCKPMEKTTGWRKVVRRLFWGGLICLAAAAAVVGSCNAIVKHSAKGHLYSNVQEIPYRQVGLLLGTSPTMANGNPNRYYHHRIEAAASLYLADKISYILISGDNHRHGYNEPEEMRQSLIDLGIPDSAITLDYAGFRTYDSMVRASEVFGQRSLTVISQYWHNERAVYIARRKGMDAVAFNAQDVSYRKSYLKNHTRESLAKVKAVWDVATGKDPRYWGEPVAIPDGQTTEYKDSIRQLAPTGE